MQCKTYGFHEFHKNVKGIWAIPYACDVMIFPDKFPVNNNIIHSEDADPYNEELLKMFVLERNHLVIYFELDVYVTD